MTESFDKEEFLKAIHTIPFWVKSADDLLRFCKHLHYRLLQEKSVNKWYRDNFDIRGGEAWEINEIHQAYNEAYDNDVREFQPCAEIFSCKKDLS